MHYFLLVFIVYFPPFYFMFCLFFGLLFCLLGFLSVVLYPFFAPPTAPPTASPTIFLGYRYIKTKPPLIRGLKSHLYLIITCIQAGLVLTFKCLFCVNLPASFNPVLTRLVQFVLSGKFVRIYISIAYNFNFCTFCYGGHSCFAVFLISFSHSLVNFLEMGEEPHLFQSVFGKFCAGVS